MDRVGIIFILLLAGEVIEHITVDHEQEEEVTMSTNNIKYTKQEISDNTTAMGKKEEEKEDTLSLLNDEATTNLPYILGLYEPLLKSTDQQWENDKVET